MVRKLVSVGAILFALGVAWFAKPAVAAPLCDCGYCASRPNQWCIDSEHGGWGMYCREFSFNYC
jgi:hypothetical protein